MEKLKCYYAASGAAGWFTCCLAELQRAESRLLPGSRSGVVVLSDNPQGSENATRVEQKYLIDELTQQSFERGTFLRNFAESKLCFPTTLIVTRSVMMRNVAEHIVPEIIDVIDY